MDLSASHFYGWIPTEIGELSVLRQLYLSRTDFMGPIPTEVAHLTLLQQFSAYETFLDSPPPEMCVLRNFWYLESLRIDCDGPCDCCTECL